MKKCLRHLSGIALLLALAVEVSAQITINQADMPTAGIKITMLQDSSGNLSPQNASASAQTWNYSTLVSSQTNTYVFLSPSATKYASHFTTANLADSLVYAPGYNYFSSTANSYSETGFVTTLYGYTAGVSLHPFFEQIPFPATYGTTDGGISNGDTLMAVNILVYDSARVKGSVFYSDTIDAFGVMTTPYGTDSVIRQKHYDDNIDSVFVHSTLSHMWSLYTTRVTKNYQYRWYAKGIPYYFALMQMNSTNTKDSLVQWFKGSTVGINEISHSVFTRVYPNPCKTEITFSCSSQEAKQITVFDITGRQLFTQEIKNGILTMNTSAYSTGMYFYRVSDISGNMLDRGKFIVQ